MKTILFMATSVNGMIADKDGSEDFLSHKNWETFVSIAKETGNFIVGRNTYEAVREWDDGYGFDDLPELDRVVITKHADVVGDGYLTATSAEEALEKLAEKGHTTALVTGGAHTNVLFVDHYDEIRINVEPVLLGEGLPLFHPSDLNLRLELLDSHDVGEGIVQLRYRVLQ